MKPRKETAPLAKEREIRALLARKAREKLSYTQLSRLTGIPKGTLAFWAHKLRKAGKAAAPSSPKDGAPSPFVEVLVPPREASLQCPAIELVLPQGLLRIPPGFHGPSLKALLHILQEEEC